MKSVSTRCHWLLRIAVGGAISGAICGAIALSTNCALAQITPDKTLPNNSTVRLDGSTHIIEGGTRAGGNLFHSFGEFSVRTGETAHFNNAVDIQNIFGRVTGGSVSNIDGVLRANGTANLFLINPNGIIFGKNASLNVGGSFVGTTANAIQFGNLGSFSATNPEAPSPLLTINPSALLFNQIAVAPIQNNSVAPAGKDPAGFNTFGLRVPDGQSLMLVGGDININSGGLFAFGGLVELGGLAAPGTLGLSTDGNKLQLSFPVGVRRSDVFLTNTGIESSDVNIKAGKLLTDSTYFNLLLSLKEQDIRNISVQADSSVSFKNSDIRANGNISVQTNGSVSSKDTYIYAGNLSVQTNGSVSLASTETNPINFIGTVGANDVQIQARSVSFINGVVVNAGKLTVKADYIKLDRSELQGNDIKLQVRDLLLMRDKSLITTNNYNYNSLITTNNYNYNSGNIRIDAPHGFIVAINKSDIITNSRYGNAGNVTINITGIFGIKALSLKDLIEAPPLGFGTAAPDGSYIMLVERLNPQTLPTSGITAFSEQNPSRNGTIQINTLSIDPVRGLARRPLEVVDATRLIDQNFCAATAGTGSSFTIAGRGGLPPSPNSVLNSDAVWEDWRFTAVPPNHRPTTARDFQPITPKRATPEPIVEATGWVKNAKGEIELTANPPTVTSHSPWLTHPSCHT